MGAPIKHGVDAVKSTTRATLASSPCGLAAALGLALTLASACTEVVEIASLDEPLAGEPDDPQADCRGPVDELGLCFSSMRGRPGQRVVSHLHFVAPSDHPSGCAPLLHQVDGTLQLTSEDALSLVSVEAELHGCVQRVPRPGQGIDYLVLAGGDCGPWSPGVVDTLEFEIAADAEPGLYSFSADLALQSPGGAGAPCDFNLRADELSLRVTVDD